MVAIKLCLISTGFGNPVDPEVCKTRNGSFATSAYVLVHGYASTTLGSSKSLSSGSSNSRLPSFSSKDLKRSSGLFSRGRKRVRQSVASSNDKSASKWFLGDGKRAYLHDQMASVDGRGLVATDLHPKFASGTCENVIANIGRTDVGDSLEIMPSRQ